MRTCTCWSNTGQCLAHGYATATGHIRPEFLSEPAPSLVEWELEEIRKLLEQILGAILANDPY